VWGTGTPKDRDEVNRREVYEYDGCVCDRGAKGTPSIFKVIRSIIQSLLSNDKVKVTENLT
jgi:hypothetical protein